MSHTCPTCGHASGCLEAMRWPLPRAFDDRALIERNELEKVLTLIAEGDERPGHIAALSKKQMVLIARAALLKLSAAATAESQL